eukprot:CAMPEP_0119129028 /NCGR_PEP_ID=MMETSP1310-20130426/6950_1 /TAXON_ID=464262 /ORGANISM="Genus nov. species nov., Strain RCC2339" /LENGTH=275 /DNA_ID=CAMNT_0007119425 /DNA_START=15 /DNA_END=838 /DNA_ORIENTATION=+
MGVIRMMTRPSRLLPKLRHSSAVSFVEVTPGLVQYYTVRFNEWLHDLARLYRSVWQTFFHVGAYAGVVLMVAALSLLVYNLGILLFAERPADAQAITPLVPGLNIPLAHVLHIFVVLLINGIWHEGGHAMAAEVFGIPIRGFGVFFMILYPGAFVDLPETLRNLPNREQLSVYAAGAWHNILMGFLAAGVLFALPWLLNPVVKLNPEGVTVMTTVGDDSFGLQRGDVVTAIGECAIAGLGGWQACLRGIADPHSWCVPLELAERGRGQSSCCKEP